MKQDVFDILLYLFENYAYEDENLDQDRDTLQSDLLEAGFHHDVIGKAFDWLEGLSGLKGQLAEFGVSQPGSMRIYGENECRRLDRECRGFLLFLEQMKVLDHQTREMVIDRVMALESELVDLEQLKWVVLMVLFNQPEQEAAATWMEDLVLDEMAGPLH
jgi:Smg protein